MTYGPQPGRTPYRQPGPRPANTALPVIAAVMALLTLAMTILLRVNNLGLRFVFDWPLTLDLPGHLIVLVTLTIGVIMLFAKNRCE
jgi:hypothetical protein